MAVSTIFIPVLPSTIKLPSFQEEALSVHLEGRPRREIKKFFLWQGFCGEATFDKSKLHVLILGVDEKKHPGKFQRTYTLTHCDLSSRLTLAISHTINNSLLDFDISSSARNSLSNYPELQEALVWIHFHSNITKSDRLECWGSLKENAATIGGISGSVTVTVPVQVQEQAEAETPGRLNRFPTQGRVGAGPLPIGGAANEEEKPRQSTSMRNLEFLKPCQEDCDCCFAPKGVG